MRIVRSGEWLYDGSIEKPVDIVALDFDYQAGDRVRAVNRHPVAHTRSPRYARGRRGVIIRHCAVEPLPELAAESICARQHVYCVRFEAAELWGTAARDALYLELSEEYLEPVS